MKALIFSDSHRYLDGIRAAVAQNRDTKLIIHAGDVQSDVEEILRTYQRIPCAYVLGNNDFYVRDVPNDRFFEFGGAKIFLTHGHLYSVKLSPARVVAEARKRGADVCIFGHTHSAYLDYGDMWVVNPGSARFGYAVMTVEDGDINIELKKL